MKRNLFIQQGESTSQWYVCKGTEEDYSIIWIEYSEKEAKDMMECIIRMSPKCRKRKR